MQPVQPVVPVTSTVTETNFTPTTVYVKLKFHIENFDALMNATEPGEGQLWSEGVTSELAPDATWKLSVFPNSDEEESWGSISVFINLTGKMVDNKESLVATPNIYLVGEDPTDIDVLYTGYREAFTNDYHGHSAYGAGRRNIQHERVRLSLKADGSLHVVASIQFLVPYDCKDLYRWAIKIAGLYGDAASSDCSILIGGVAIRAHRSILSAHSPVFRAMLTNPAMQEYTSGVVDITDYRHPEPMRILVRYCYQSQVDAEALDGIWAVELFELACKYCIDELKDKLEGHFIDNRLNVNTVVDMAILADSFNAKELKKACVALITHEWDTIIRSAKWEKLEHEDPELADDLVNAATADP